MSLIAEVNLVISSLKIVKSPITGKKIIFTGLEEYNIDNIEILNGSQGTLYGGNAIGGVISINSSLPEEYGLKEINFLEAGLSPYSKTLKALLLF